MLQDENLPQPVAKHIFRALDIIKDNQALSKVAMMEMHIRMSKIELRCYERYVAYSRMLDDCSGGKSSSA